MKNLIILVLVCVACFSVIAACVSQNRSSSNARLNPMESFVCSVDGEYSIVRNDETRRNVFTLRHRETLALAFETKFEKYLETYLLEGKPFLAAAYWHPAFGYQWYAWVRDGKVWRQLLPEPCAELSIIDEEGQPTRLRCATGPDGQNVVSYTLQELLAR